MVNIQDEPKPVAQLKNVPAAAKNGSLPSKKDDSSDDSSSDESESEDEKVFHHTVE